MMPPTRIEQLNNFQDAVQSPDGLDRLRALQAVEQALPSSQGLMGMPQVQAPMPMVPRQYGGEVGTGGLLEVLDDTDHKILLFVPYKHTIEFLAEFLTSKKITNSVINGAVSANERANIINKFQTQDEPRVLVIQPQSASHGVTLTKADTVVFWSPVMSVEVYLQCIARMDRVGQKNKMTVVHLQGSDVEKRLYAMLQGKVDAHTKLVDLYREVLEE